MAHYAYVVDGIVERVHVLANAVITDDNGVEQEALGQEFLGHLHGLPGENFVQCSYNGNFRNLYPGAGYLYNETLDAFILPKPGGDWILNEDTYSWEPVSEA
jgi:hypothetical protein